MVEKHVPSKVIGRVRARPPWFDTKLAALIRQKHLAWRAYKRHGSPDLLASFRLIRNKVTASLRLAEHRHLQTLHRDMASSTSSTTDF